MDLPWTQTELLVAGRGLPPTRPGRGGEPLLAVPNPNGVGEVFIDPDETPIREPTDIYEHYKIPW